MEKPESLPKEKKEMKSKKDEGNDGPTVESTLNELKNSTLLSYSQKATNDLAFSGDGKKKARKRATGIKTATGRLAMRATDPDGKLGWNKNPKNEGIKYDKSGSSMDYFLGADPKKTKEYKALKKKKTQKEGIEDIIARLEKKRIAKGGNPEDSPLPAMKKYHADKKKKVKKEEVENVDEAKVDKGRSDYGKASIRNYRRKGPGHGDPGMFDPEGKRGKTIELRRKEHKARRGVKGAKVPAYKVEGSSWGVYKGDGLSPAERLKKKAKELQAADKKKKKTGNPAFDDPSHHSNAKNRYEELKSFKAYHEVTSCDQKKAIDDAKLKRKEDLKVAKYKTKKEENAYANAEKVREEVQEKTYSTKTLDALKANLTERATTYHVEATRLKKEKGYVKGGTKKPSSNKKDPALQAVLDRIRKDHGKGAVLTGGSRQQKKVKGAKSTAGTGKYKKAADNKKQTAADAKKRGFKSTQNYVDTMARYGGKDNYDRGRGLGT